MENKKILILGVGNILLGDEGFGVHAQRYLEENFAWPENVKLVDGGTLGLMLMSELMECDLAIILDIARGGEACGTFYRLEGNDTNRALSLRQSAHQTGIEDVLISCDLAGHRPDSVIFAMEPYNYSDCAPLLSLEAQEKLPEFCRIVVRELEKMGIKAMLK